MRLSFSILWFDDSEEYFDSLPLDSLEEIILSSWGFFPKINTVTTSDEFIECAPFNSYDLIVMDYDLQTSKNGADFIAHIRNNTVYTEVIFYTAGETRNLWKMIHEKELEGVFISSRSEIFSKIEKVGQQSIRKVLDLENMRGIVMAEVGELDYLLDEIITIGIEELEEQQRRKIYEKFYRRAISTLLNK